MINKRGPKPGTQEEIASAFPMSPALLAASCSCRPSCRQSIVT